MNSESNNKHKIPKKKTLATTNPESSSRTTSSSEKVPSAAKACPLLAKDSEWVDILQTMPPGPAAARPPRDGDVGEEEVLQLVECEEGPNTKPLAIMFPGLLDKDPATLHGMLSRAMSTTEVTRQLVHLGQKANFEFMKKADRLIPPDKQWLESLTENSNSVGSLSSSAYTSGKRSYSSTSYEASDELSIPETIAPKKKKRPNPLSKLNPPIFVLDIEHSDDDDDDDSTIDQHYHCFDRKPKTQ